MLDLKYIRENSDEVKKFLKARNSDFDLDVVLDLDKKRREILGEVEALKNKRNESSTLIGKLKREKKDASELLKEMQTIGDSIKSLDENLAKVEEKLNYLLYRIPNKLHSSVPFGKDEDENVEVRRWGTPRKFDFPIKTHDELGVALDILDFERGSKLAGSRFTVYKKQAARLERALINFMLDTHTNEHGFTEIMTPQMAKREIMTGTGQLPKFEDDMYLSLIHI